MGPKHWEWDYRPTEDDRRPAPPPEEPEAEREARERLGVGKSTWRALQGQTVTLRDYEKALARDQERAERQRGPRR